MMQYKWQLRKGSKKDICPKCGKKRFVPFVLAIDGVTKAGAEFGRCDREQHCGYFRYPDGEKYEERELPPAPEEHPYVIDMELCDIMMKGYKDSNLYKFMRTVLSEEATNRAFDAYKVGGTNNGSTAFWQISKNGICRAGKIIQYGEDGHRIKSGFPVQWAHKVEGAKRFIIGDTLKQCFFGEHLLQAKPNARVNIVESEKTAVFMDAMFPSYVWLASGGAQGLKNAEKNRALKGRNVWLYPDNGKFFEWWNIATANGWQCNNAAEKEPCFDGCDVMDMILKVTNHG